MTTQPNFVSDLPSVNSNGDAVIQSSQQPTINQRQSESQNLSSSQPSETQATPSIHPQAEVSAQVPQDSPLSLAKVLVPAQVAVVAHSFTEHQSQQQSVLFQALTAQSAPQFIALTVPSQESERHEIAVPGVPSLSCVQYIDEGGGTNVFSSANSQMTTFSIYTTPETANMYTPNSSTYFSATNSTENYTQVNISENQGQESGCQTFTEEQDVFQVLEDGSMTESENSHMSCYPSSRLSAASMKWLVDNYEVADSMSVPRSAMYNHYLKHCNEQKMEPLNAASFGKLIRIVFNGLRTRRLGTRGNSKYHYYGIRLKPTSPINTAMEDIVNTTYRHHTYLNMRRLKSENVKSENNSSCNGKRFFESDEPDKKRSGAKSHHVYLGDASTAIPHVEIDMSNCPLPPELTVEKVNLFKDDYRQHCEDILSAVVNFQFSDVEHLWHSFWNTSTENRTDSHPDLTKPFLLELVAYDPVKEFIKQTDYRFYQNLVDVLIPDVLRPIPSTLTQAIRNFAKSLEGWLKAAITECGDDILAIKLSAISAFAQTLRRYTSLNHLAQAARAVLQSPTQIKQMTADLNKVDFRNIQEQASWVCQCDDESIRQILNEFRQTLQLNVFLEDWAAWLENIVHKTLEPYEGKPSYPKAARQFLLKWSFYSSLVIRDLTLRSAASFGSFHLLRLLYDEFMFFVIEHCIAKATGTSSVAVMGEYLHSGSPEQLTEMIEPLEPNCELYLSSESSEVDAESNMEKLETSQECKQI